MHSTPRRDHDLQKVVSQHCMLLFSSSTNKGGAHVYEEEPQTKSVLVNLNFVYEETLRHLSFVQLEICSFTPKESRNVCLVLNVLEMYI